MARSFSNTGAVLKDDFRIDLNGHAASATPRVAHGAQTGLFVFAWRDNRNGHFDMYVRAVSGR